MGFDALGTFNQELQDFANKKVPADVVKLQRLVGLQVLRGVVTKCPVDTGRARGNWQASVAAPAAGVLGTEKDGGKVISREQATIGNVKFGEVLFITNNLPYIERLEDGWSGQAPAGMIDVTLGEVQAQFQD